MITSVIEVEDLLQTPEGARSVLRMLESTELGALSPEEQADLRRRAIRVLERYPTSQR